MMILPIVSVFSLVVFYWILLPYWGQFEYQYKVIWIIAIVPMNLVVAGAIIYMIYAIMMCTEKKEDKPDLDKQLSEKKRKRNKNNKKRLQKLSLLQQLQVKRRVSPPKRTKCLSMKLQQLHH